MLHLLNAAEVLHDRKVSKLLWLGKPYLVLLSDRFGDFQANIRPSDSQEQEIGRACGMLLFLFELFVKM